MRACGVPPQPPARRTARKCWARNALLSRRVPTGGSFCRIRLRAVASAPLPPGGSGAISRPASRDRRVRLAPTYASIVPFRSTLSGREACLEPPRRINSARSTSLSRLYAAPCGVEGSTNGSRSVDTRKSPNQASTVPVRLASVTSSMRARAAVRSACTLSAAVAECAPLRHLSSMVSPRGPEIPNSAARCAMSAAPSFFGPCASIWPATKAEMSALHLASTAAAPAAVAPLAALPAGVQSSAPVVGLVSSVGSARSAVVSPPTVSCHHALARARDHTSCSEWGGFPPALARPPPPVCARPSCSRPAP
eukprot:2488331-Pleurochrysis_carterae.AAC.3